MSSLRRAKCDGPFDHEYLDFMVIVTGDMPDAQATLAETHRYDIFQDFRDGEDRSQNFGVDYDRRSNRYQVDYIGPKREQEKILSTLNSKRRRHRPR